MPPEAANNRDDFTSNTKKIIAQRSGYRCAICGCQTEGPGLDPGKAVSVGDAAHITAASPRGPRYNVDLTTEQRTDADNGLWACKNHHWIIDHDKERYTVADLVSRKRRAEDLAQRLQGLEAAHGAELAAAIVAARDMSDRMITQWRDKYRYNQAGIIELDFREKSTDEGPGAVWTLARVTAAISQGHKLLLAGRAGAGKTITLIQVAEQLAAKAEGPVPLIFSVSGWIATNRDLASHVITQLTNNGVTVAAASLLLATGRVAILLNGWNEAPDAEQARASELLNDFLLNYSLPGLVLSTRATRHAPTLVGETFLDVLPLTAAKRGAIVRAANLPDPGKLLRQIDQSRILAEVTETPLFLGAAIKLARSGRPIPNSRAGLLESFLTDLQDTDTHAARLHALPCQDCHYRYETDLAVEMTRTGVTVLPIERTLATIGACSTSLIAVGRIGQAGAASAIAESLAQHHALLYLPDVGPGYGFIHQQFQEWFASRWLLVEVKRLAARPDIREIFPLQRDYLNQPAWQESIAFVMESLISEHLTATAVALVRWMMPVDLIRAAELVNLSGAEVWAVVRDELGRALRAWHGLAGSHRDCALTAMLATGQADFADLVWPHLETDDQAMFWMCRLHEPFRIAVLGAGAVDRLAMCPEKVETMFLREISQDVADDEIAYADVRARQGSPAVRVSALHLLVEQGRFARVLEILLAREFGDWHEDIYEDVLSYVPAALLAPHAATVRAKFDATESLPLRGGIVEFLRRVAHPQWIDLAQSELSRALAEFRSAPMFPMRGRETPATPAMRAISHYTHMLWRTHKDWMAAWLVEQFGENLPDPLSNWLMEFPEDALVAIATRIAANTRVDNRASATVDRLLASGSIRVARIFIDAYVTATLAGQDTVNLPRTEEMRQKSPAVLRILVDAVLAKAETVTDFPQLRALIGALSPVSALDNSLGEQIDPAQRDLLRAMVVRTSEAIPSDEEAHHYRPTLAVLLGSLGAREDVAVVVRWVADENARWEAHRRQVVEAAAARPMRRVRHFGTSYWNWYSGALALFRCAEAEAEFLRWLDHPWLPAEGADGLVDLSLMDGSLPRLPETGPFRRTTPVPARALDDIRPAVRLRADAIVRAIERIEELPAEDFSCRFLPTMAAALGRLHDVRAIDRLLALDRPRHGWTILGATTCMQARGMMLPGRRLAQALEPFIAEHEAVNYGSNDQWYAVEKALRLLLFSDAPAAAVERMRRLPEARMNSYHARDIFALLARSPAPEAAVLLLEYSNAIPLRGGAFSELLDALAMSPDTRCHARLLELLHVPEAEMPGGNRSNLHRCILHVAESDAAFRVQLTEAIRQGTVQWEQPPRFGPTIGNAELLESMLGSGDLRLIERELRQLIVELAETHEAAGGGSYYVFPADATVTKQRLARVLASGEPNAEVASRLLAVLRLKRIEHGQPAREPLHPDVSLLESRVAFWPVHMA
jgi:hypothetical protein